MSGTAVAEVGKVKRSIEIGAARGFEDLENEALKLRGEMDTRYTELAEVLHEIFGRFDVSADKKAEVKKATGYDDFEEWAEKKFGWARRKAYYLVSVWENLFVKAGLSRPQISKVAWSKAKELVPLAKAGKIDKDNAQEWIEKAEKSTVDQLKAAVKTKLKKRGEPDAEVFIPKTFRLTKAQARNVDAALAVAGEVTESDKDGHNLDAISTEFLANHVKGDGRETGLAKACAAIERAYGVKLVAVDVKAGKIVHGEKEVDALVAAAGGGVETDPEAEAPGAGDD